MAKILENGYRIAKKDIHTDAYDMFSHLLKSAIGGDDTLDPAEVEYYSEEELNIIKPILESKGVIKKGEKYYYLKVRGHKSDEWQGVMTFIYPDGAYEIMVEHDMFDN